MAAKAKATSAIRPLSSGWTLDTLQAHMSGLIDANERLNERLDAERDRFNTERDRRYSEVNIEREKALKIKEEADKAALGLAREIQTYKDEKANQLREQISGERGTYVTKDELASSMREMQVAMAPLFAFVNRQGGAASGTDQVLSRAIMFITASAAMAALAVSITILIRGIH